MSAAAAPSRSAKVRPKRLPHWTPPAVVPNHVKQCNRGTGSRLWWIYTWRTSTPQNRIRVPYCCNSWRCELCAPHEAAVLFRRITDACQPLEPRGWVFMVLTLDQRGLYSGGKPRFRDSTDAYLGIGKQSQSFLYRLRRWQKRNGHAVLGSQWFAVVEQHANGFPHVNLCIYAPELADLLDQEQEGIPLDPADPQARTLLQGELRAMAIASGWGPRSTAERARDRKALAGYVTKVAGKADATAGEIAKVTQAPVSAPPKFRRLRSGKGFLPPRKGTAEGWTGALIRRQWDNEGGPSVLPLHRATPEHAINVAGACYLEEQIWQTEMERIARDPKAKRYGPHAVLGPPVQYWEGDRRLRQDEWSEQEQGP